MPGWVSFKCEPNRGMDWRQQYPGTVRRGWHCPPVQQPYNNTLTMDGTVPDDVLRQMLFHSYDCALDSLSRAAREELLGSLRPYTADDERYILSWIPDEETYWRWSAGSVGQWPLAPGMFNDRMAQFPLGHPMIWLWQGQPAGFVVAFPQKDREHGIRFGYVVTDPALRARVLSMFELMLKDNLQARRLMADGTYVRMEPGENEPVNAQEIQYQQAYDAAQKV